MILKLSINFEKHIPSLKEYQSLFNTTGWMPVEDHKASKALKNTLFATCVYVDKRFIGMGRVVGDDSMYFYLQDIIVAPEFRKLGIGARIVKTLIDYVYEQNDFPFIGLMAAQGSSSFYQKLGFLERKQSAPGMYIFQHKNDPK